MKKVAKTFDILKKACIFATAIEQRSGSSVG